MLARIPLYDTPSVLRRIAILAAALAMLGVLSYRIADIRTPPPLEIATPTDQLSTVSRIITVAGATAPGAMVLINGEMLAPNAEGAFTADIILLPGVNTIAIEARFRHSRTARIERVIHVHAANAPLASSASAHPKYEV